MGSNLITLISHMITLSDEVDLRSSFHYTKDSVRFMFFKDNMSIGWDFTLIEIDNIEDVSNQCNMLTDRVYKLLDKIQSK